MGTANTYYICTYLISKYICNTYVVTGNGQNDVTELQYTLFLIDTHKIHVEYYYYVRSWM